jgi:hypothetical protein
MKGSILLVAASAAILFPGLASADVFDVTYTDTDTSGFEISMNLLLTADLVSPGVYVIDNSEPYSGGGYNNYTVGSYSVNFLYAPGSYPWGTADNYIYVPATTSYFSNFGPPASNDTNGFAFTDGSGNTYEPYYCNADLVSTLGCTQGDYYEYNTLNGGADFQYGTQININITDPSVTPEPSTAMLMGAGMAVVGFALFRRRTA